MATINLYPTKSAVKAITVGDNSTASNASNMYSQNDVYADMNASPWDSGSAGTGAGLVYGFSNSAIAGATINSISYTIRYYCSSNSSSCAFKIGAGTNVSWAVTDVSFTDGATANNKLTETSIPYQSSDGTATGTLTGVSLADINNLLIKAVIIGADGLDRYDLYVDVIYITVDYTPANTSPGTPSSITVPAVLTKASQKTISWGASSDAENNLVGYKLERQYNGGTWTQIYQGANTSYVDTIGTTWTSVAYRVKAYDSFGAESAYMTSSTVSVYGGVMFGQSSAVGYATKAQANIGGVIKTGKIQINVGGTIKTIM